MERARRIGWGLIACALAAVLADRAGLAGGPLFWRSLAVACALLGGLAIVNVALVRSLYRQIAAARADAPPPARASENAGASENIPDANGVMQREVGDGKGS